MAEFSKKFISKSSKPTLSRPILQPRTFLRQPYTLDCNLVSFLLFTTPIIGSDQLLIIIDFRLIISIHLYTMHAYVRIVCWLTVHLNLSVAV